MDAKVKQLIIDWMHGDYSERNIERIALWMRDALRVGGVRQTRAWVREAIAGVR